MESDLTPSDIAELREAFEVASEHDAVSVSLSMDKATALLALAMRGIKAEAVLEYVRLNERDRLTEAAQRILAGYEKDATNDD